MIYNSAPKFGTLYEPPGTTDKTIDIPLYVHASESKLLAKKSFKLTDKHYLTLYSIYTVST